MLVLSLLNPLGPAPPPVLASQVAGMAVIGAVGHLVRVVGTRRAKLEILAMGSGAVLTLAYDALTNYGVAVSIGKWRDPLVVMIAGLPLAAVHVAANTMVFGAVAALVARKPWLLGAGKVSKGSGHDRETKT
jgi:hypothetical protein